MSVTAVDDNPTVGKSFSVECNLTVAKSIAGSVDIIWRVNDSDNVSISWIGPDDVINSRITVTPTTSDGYIHTSTLQFSYISEEDENTSYSCTPSLSGDHELLSKSFIMTNLTSKSNH